MFSTDLPEGHGVFNQFDIVTAQQAGLYLAGPYAGVHTGSLACSPHPGLCRRRRWSRNLQWGI